MSRGFLTIALAATCVVLTPGAMAQYSPLPAVTSPAQSTSVKSSKSNSSDRTGQAATAAAKTTTVKSSKSNTSDRKGKTDSSGPANKTNLNSSRSN
ncbi:MAG: hypothetical protein QOJ96_152 [Alphaproteobacteria bacterium]|jgi:hypothetical protein|nr:hypothetical protein [Alphaproteobacteria bacterium]